MIKHQLVPAKDWIIENQNNSGSIYWTTEENVIPGITASA